MAETKKYYHNVDVDKNKVVNLLLNPLTTTQRTAVGATLGTADQGYVCYDTNLNKPYFWNGTQWAVVGGNQNLQQVTDIGSVTTNSISINSLNLFDSTNSSYASISSNNNQTLLSDSNGDYILGVKRGYLRFYSTIGGSLDIGNPANPSALQLTYILPNIGGTLPISVNNQTADNDGAIFVNLQQITDEGNITTNSISINTQNQTSLVVNSNSYEDDSQGISVYGGDLAIGATGINNGIFSIADEIGIKTEATGGISLLAKLSNFTQEGIRIQSSYSSNGTPLIITKDNSVGASINKLIVNQEGEITATKLIKQGGTSTQYLMADGSVTTASVSPTLQQVTNQGNITTNNVGVNSLSIFDPISEIYGNLSFAEGIFNVKSNSSQFIFNVENTGLYFYNGTYQAQITSGLLTATRNYQLPDASGNIPLSVNGNTADSSGNITIPTSTSPLTTKGDLYTYSTTNTRLPVGLNSQILVADNTTATGLKWATNTAATPTGYYLAISDSTTQTNPTTDTPRAVKFDTTDLANGFSLQTETAVFTGTISNGGAGAGTILNVTGVTSGTLKVGMVLTGGSITAGTFISAFTSGTGGIGTYVVSVSQLRTSATYTGTMTSQIVVANTGIYNLQFSSQLDKSDAGVDIANFWLRRNGLDVPYSAGNLSLQGNSPAYMMAAWNYVIQLVAGDIIELYWASPDANMSIYSEVVQTSPYPHPAIQSTILTITQQSGIMAGTGISRGIYSISTNTTAGSGANVDYVYLVSGTTTITLPTAAGNTNRYTIKRSGTGVVSIATTSGQTIDGSSSPITINVQYVSIDLISNGTNWEII